ncbi:MAG: T9SS type A sorting domain-containing protein [Caldisericaceae bacterium]|nr:T9SS type A sorting domain-containing protein [Caldisericaceae bacterium]
MEKIKNRILIKTSAGRIVYILGIPVIRDGKGRIIGRVEYYLTTQKDGTGINIIIPDNVKQLNTVQLSLEIDNGYNPSELSIGGLQEYFINDNLSGSASKGGANIGRWIESDTTYYSYRAYEYFDISELPSTAVIDSAKYKINFKLTSESFTVYLQQMSQHYQNPPSVLWDDCADGNYYGSFDSNKNGYFTNIYYSWDDFCGDIQNNITNGWFGIGFYTSDEPQEYTTIIQPADTSLIIYYHDPNAYFDFTVKYDFGVGDFTINDSFGERIEQTPYTNAYQYGSQVKVTAHNQMGSDNYYRVFEKWERTIGNEETKTFYDSVSTCEVTDSVLYKGRFNRRFNFTAQNEFIDGGSGGQLKVDGDQTVAAPYFRYFIENVGQPFTIEAIDQTQTVNGRNVNYFFFKWDDNITSNPREFNPDDNMTKTAKYKGHLASNKDRATGYNNGRRIFKAEDGTLYLVYEDNGDIWFTSSEDEGKTWAKETRVDSDNKTSLNPSIAGTLDMLFITWFDQDDLNVKMRKFNMNNSQWYPEHTVASVNFGVAIKPAPAISVSEVVGNEYNVYIAFHREKMSETFQPTGIHEIVCYKNIDQNFDQWNLILGPFDGRNPSLSHSQAGNNGDIGMVWDHNGKIYFKGTNYFGNWTSTYQISDDLWYHQDNCKANISYTYGIAHIVWEGYHAITEMPTGYYRYFDVDDERLSDLTVLPSHGADVHHLSVSSQKYADNTTAYNYSIVYEGDGVIKVTQTSDNFQEENFGEGQYPNITEHDMNRSVWTTYNDAPFLLKTDYQENSGGGVSPIIINPTPVIDYVLSANQNNSVEGTITLEVEAVKLNHDTVYFDNALKSKTMSITQDYVPLEMDLKVRFHNVYNGFNDEDVLYLLVFDDSTQSEIFLTNLKYKELPTPNGADLEKFFKLITIVNLAGKTGKICLKTDGITPTLVTKRLEVFNQSTLNKSRPVTNVIPKMFDLDQNFPNPFNPVTHITVDLPRESNVDLSVFTISGKKVQTLMQGQQSAGTYEVIFDGRNLASGIYIYRLTTDKGFTQSRKMMLIK